MKILHLEDNQADAELTGFALREEWPESEIAVVASRDEFLAHLAEAPDVILSDFNMPGFSGLEALRLANERHPETPFVFLSGTIGEDRAIEAMRSGASDYVIKDRPKRLVPAIKRAVEAAGHARERRDSEERMRRVQRLENLGMLAAGIAHDFNNVLAPVLMGIPLVRQQVGLNGKASILDTMERSAERGAGLVRQILGFAQGVTGEPQIVQPKHVLRELLSVVQQTFPKSIRVEDGIAGQLWPIRANPTQLHQVVLNLCVNARDAMPAGGTLALRAHNRTIDAAEAAVLSARPGSYVQLEVSDSGTGIPAEVLPRIWDPFFTTKGPEKGTGLGLATVKAIVAEHQGYITLRSSPQGTTFEILLPAEPVSVAETQTRDIVAVPRANGELALVVDDDTGLREVAAATLTGHGYRVLTARNGTEALALAAPRSLDLRLIVTDFDMPDLDGAALARVAVSLNPNIRVILMSGSSAIEDRGRAVPPGGKFLSKPFSAHALLESAHALLSHPESPAP